MARDASFANNTTIVVTGKTLTSYNVFLSPHCSLILKRSSLRDCSSVNRTRRQSVVSISGSLATPYPSLDMLPLPSVKFETKKKMGLSPN